MKKYLENRINELNERWENIIKIYRKETNEKVKNNLWQEAEEIEIRIDELEKLLTIVE